MEQPQGTWRECEAPEGLDVGGLGQVPAEHAGRWYVKHPDTGKVLGFVAALHTGIPVVTGTSALASLSAVLTQLGAAVSAMQASPTQQTVGAVETAWAMVGPVFTQVQQQVAQLQQQVADLTPSPINVQQQAPSQGSGNTRTPAPPRAAAPSAGLSKGALAGIVGTGAAVVGFAGGFAAGRMTGREKTPPAASSK